MRHYKDNKGQVFAYEDDGSQDDLIGDKVPMTDEEVKTHIDPPKTEEQLKTEKLITFKTAVQTAIDKTDSVALRCWKAGVEFPTEWREYTVTLRTLLASKVVVELPAMPEYPSGS